MSTHERMAYVRIRDARRLLGYETKRLQVDPVSNPKHPVVLLFVKAAELEEQLSRRNEVTDR